METLAWVDDHLRLLDQTRLPREEVYLDLYECHEVADAIRRMQIRGAPALGCAGAYGVALAARSLQHLPRAEFRAGLDRACEALIKTRPTAVNLSWGVTRLRMLAVRCDDPQEAADALLREAIAMQAEDVRVNRALGRHGQVLLPDGATVLTHCNAGALATAGYGTALGVVRAAVEAGKAIHVFADETRPLLQGARLTAWELAREGISTTLIADTMAGSFMRQGRITCVVVGADRIAANGDVVNKIGTYQVAVLAHENAVPFYVAAPTSTIDLTVATGDAIQIEQRAPEEVTAFAGVRTAPEEIGVENPAFDVTPARYVTAIITERGIAHAPYALSLPALYAGGEHACREELREPNLPLSSGAGERAGG